MDRALRRSGVGRKRRGAFYKPILPGGSPGKRLRRSNVVLLCLLATSLLGPVWAGVSTPKVPEGCDAIYAATTRGGAQEPRGGRGAMCTLGRRGVLVIRVIDGDTIVVAGERRVRYIGVDTPEVAGTRERYGPEATAFNRELVEGRRVRLEKEVSETDRFGRLLRYVYVDGILVNAELVREGYAEAIAYRPDDRYAGCFASLEKEAREVGRGMWGR